MPEYLAPGVYIEELPGLRPIEGVGTSTAGLVGQTERGPTDPKLTTSWLEFQRWYGGLTDPGESYLSWAVQGFFANGGQRAFIARVTRNGAVPANLNPGALVIRAIGPGTWGNRVFVRIWAPVPGKPGFRLTVIYYERDDLVPDPFVDPFDNNRPVRERPTPSATEDFDNLGVDPQGANYVLTTINAASNLINLEWAQGQQPTQPAPAPFTPLTGGDDGAQQPTLDDYLGDPSEERTGLRALGRIDEIALLTIPDEVKGGALQDLTDNVLEQCERLKDRFAVVQFQQGRSDPQNIVNTRTSLYGASYWPWINVPDPRTPGGVQLVPPGGHVLGIYARTDIARGVHKAPANEEVRGIITRDLPGPGHMGPLEFRASKGTQDILNPKGVNVIRDFRADRRGIRVWGARTMAADPEWKYVNVRRLFIFLEESIDEGTQFVVFEPNSEPTWAIVRRSISSFLTRVWRDGALMGTTPEEAFFVKCDRTTMTQDDLDNGRLICLIGVAPVKPAEFVIFRFSQKTLEAEAA
jgi:phage tail sheath protein FI